MKMKSFLVAAIVATAALFSGCATNAAQPLSPAQIAAIACPQINLAISQLTVFNTALIANPATASLGTKANAEIAKWQPDIAAVCAAGATVTATNVQALAQQVLPALGTVVGSLPLGAELQTQIQGALVLAETAVGIAGVVEQQIQAAKAAPAPASTAAPAKS